MAGGFAPHENLANPSGLSFDATISAGQNIATGSAANTYGAWTQLYAATPFDVTHLLLEPNLNPSSSGILAFNIAAAPSGSEASGLIFQNLVFAVNFGGNLTGSLLLPVGPIKAGSRLAVQAASTAASDTANLGLIGFDCGAMGPLGGGAPAIWDTYGWSGSGAIQGVTLDPGATANTKGAYVTLVSSVTNDLRGFVLGFDFLGNNPPAGFLSNTLLVDVALGAAGAEVPIIPNMVVGHNYGSDGSVQVVGVSPTLSELFLMPIKAGTRVAVRAQCSITDATGRLIGVSLYGLRA